MAEMISSLRSCSRWAFVAAERESSYRPISLSGRLFVLGKCVKIWTDISRGAWDGMGCGRGWLGIWPDGIGRDWMFDRLGFGVSIDII